jgi:hypothetical protein
MTNVIALGGGKPLPPAGQKKLYHYYAKGSMGGANMVIDRVHTVRHAPAMLILHSDTETIYLVIANYEWIRAIPE